MPSWDHFVDAVNDFAFLKATDGGDADRQARNNRRRLAAAAFIPVAVLLAYVAGSLQSWPIAVVGFVALGAAMYVYAERPRFGSKS